MIHLFNGDAAADVFRRTGFPGDVIVWREALTQGPTPPAASDREWIDTRASFIASGYDQPLDVVTGEIDRALSLLDSIGNDELVIWIECDLACQLTAAFVLHRLHASRPDHPTALISIDAFPGHEDFRGLGQLQPSELATLLPARKPLGPAEKSDYVSAWSAYTSAEPEAIRREVGALTNRHLRETLAAHLQRFPSSEDSLGASDDALLRIVAEGDPRFVTIFRRFLDEWPLLGYGDSQVLCDLRRLGGGSAPLLRVDGTNVSDAMVHLTEAGRDHLEYPDKPLQRVRYWLGGARV